MINELPTAFPWTHGDMTCTGMTLRDYFACQAMQGMLVGNQYFDDHVMAQAAYQLADAMIKTRGQE